MGYVPPLFSDDLFCFLVSLFFSDDLFSLFSNDLFVFVLASIAIVPLQ